MFFQIDAAGSVPVYEQIVRQVTFAIADGALRVGELVPSVRQLARELAINPNTVARSYRQLQDEGVLETVRGKGLQVATGSAKQCRSKRLHLIRDRFSQVLQEARQSQLSEDEIRQMIDAVMANGKPKRGDQ